MKILSIDPGLTCGFVLYNTPEIEHWGQCTPKKIYKKLELVFYDLVIIEQFIIYSWTAKTLIGSALETVELIGTVKYLCKKKEMTVYESQTQRKKPFEGKKLKKWSQFDIIKGEHVRDALRHLLAYLMQYKKINPKNVKIHTVI